MLPPIHALTRLIKMLHALRRAASPAAIASFAANSFFNRRVSLPISTMPAKQHEGDADIFFFEPPGGEV
jgi:hypothetical protein